MAPNINNPGGVKNDPDEIRDAVVSDATRFPGGFIDQQITQSGVDGEFIGQFSVGNASFVQLLDVSPQDTEPKGLSFKPDGSRLYVAGTAGSRVYEYSLGVNYDIATASFSQAFVVSSQDTTPEGVEFNSDGTELYIVGGQFENVYQYSLSTAFDISTASFTQSFDVSSEDTLPQGLVFKPDGSRLYVIGAKDVNVYQYSLSTAFDISTASFTQSFSVGAQESTPLGLAFNPDGSLLYIIGSSSQSIFQYRLSTSFDISTASFVQSFDVSSEDTTPEGLTFKPDGDQLYVVGDSGDNVYQYGVGVLVRSFE